MALQVFLTGVGCVGETTIGAELAALLLVHFHDLDSVVEEFFHKPLGRLQNQFLTSHSYRRVAVEALIDLLRRTRNQDWVIALPPSRLMYPFGREVRKSEGSIVVLQDAPENILERIAFKNVLRGVSNTTIHPSDFLTSRPKGYMRPLGGNAITDGCAYVTRSINASTATRR